MMRSRIRMMWRPLLLAPALLLLMAFRHVELVDPPPIPLPADTSQETAKHVIGQTLNLRGWRMVKDVPSEIDAVYDPRDFSVTIAVHYDARQIRINYVTSENLKYQVKHGQRYIHPNYANWIRNLVTGIHNGLMMGTHEGDRGN